MSNMNHKANICFYIIGCGVSSRVLALNTEVNNEVSNSNLMSVVVAM